MLHCQWKASVMLDKACGTFGGLRNLPEFMNNLQVSIGGSACDGDCTSFQEPRVMMRPELSFVHDQDSCHACIGTHGDASWSCHCSADLVSESGDTELCCQDHVAFVSKLSETYCSLLAFSSSPCCGCLFLVTSAAFFFLRSFSACLTSRTCSPGSELDAESSSIW